MFSTHKSDDDIRFVVLSQWDGVASSYTCTAYRNSFVVEEVNDLLLKRELLGWRCSLYCQGKVCIIMNKL